MEFASPDQDITKSHSVRINTLLGSEEETKSRTKQKAEIDPHMFKNQMCGKHYLLLMGKDKLNDL